MNATTERLLAMFILVLALLWRLPMDEIEWRYTLCENDSLFHLHRADQTLADFPNVPSIDRYSHHPDGYRPHWRNMLALSYASIGKLVGVEHGEITKLARALAFIPPALGVLAVWLLMRIARVLGLGRGALAVGFFAALSVAVVRPFFYGVIDHHAYAHVAILLLVAAGLGRRLWLWAAGHVLLCFATPEGPFYSFIALGLFSFATVFSRAQVASPRRVALWLATPAAACLLAWLLDRLPETDPPSLLEGSWIYLSFVHALALAALGIVAGTLIVIRRLDSGRTAIFLVTGIAAIVVALLALGGVETVAALLFRPSGRLFVAEERSVLGAGWSGDLPWHGFLFAAGLFHLARLPGAILREAPNRVFTRLWFMTAGTLGFLEFRHFFLLSSVQILAGATALHEIATRGAGAWRRATVGALACAGTAFFLVPYAVDPRRLHGNICERLTTIEEALSWLAAGATDSEHRNPRPGGAVFAPWYLGHQIHVLGRRPVIVDPFNTFDIEPQLKAVWWAESLSDLATALERYEADLLLVTDPVRNIFGVPTPDSTSALLLGPERQGALPVSGGMRRFAAFRIYIAGGFSAENERLRPRYLSREWETLTREPADGAEAERFSVPKVMIFELVEGATIEGVLPESASNARVEYRVRFPGREAPVLIRHDVAADEQGRFSIRTAIPAPVQETTFRVEHGYCIFAGERSALVPVSIGAVEQGGILTVHWNDADEPGGACVAAPRAR